MADQTGTVDIGNTAAPEKTRPGLGPLKALLPFMMAYKGRMLAALAALVAASAATLVVPVAVRTMIDHGFTAADTANINQTFLLLVGVVLWLSSASALRYYLVMTLGERVVADIRAAAFKHLMTLSPGYYDTARSGEVISRLTADTTQLKAAAGSSASVALRNFVLFVGALVMMIVTSPRLSAFTISAIPLIVLPLVAFGRSVRRRSRQSQDTLAEASAFAQEAVGAVRILQAFTAEAASVLRFDRAVEKSFDAARIQIRTRGALTFIAIFLVFASVVAVLWIGAQDVLAGQLSAGTLSQFVLYAVFAAGALGELSQVWGEISSAAGAAERLTELMALKPAIEKPERSLPLPARVSGRIAFDRVAFAYPSRPDQPVLHDLSFTINPGETVAVVGPSGAGKSTLFQLILRFYDPTSGSVRIDGVDIRQTDPLQLRRQLALVPQDPVIFATTARQNIGFGRPGASDADIQAAADAAHASGFIAELGEGLDTELGERGVTLSGGQRQRIAIARAILRDAPILLLDEATSALDAESEHLVQAALDGLARTRTTLVIAHRLATITGADRILVMDNGRIVEEGTHDSLVAAGGLYARLAKLQFQDI